jgi:hypothetical protein
LVKQLPVEMYVSLLAGRKHWFGEIAMISLTLSLCDEMPENPEQEESLPRQRTKALPMQRLGKQLF